MTQKTTIYQDKEITTAKSFIKIDPRDLGKDIGIGFGFTLAGIFILNLHLFFGTEPSLIQKIFGLLLSIVGTGGTFISLGKKEDMVFFNEIGVSIILFVPSFLTFIFVSNLWIKILLSIIVAFSLVTVGMAIGRTLFKEDGSLRVNFKALPRFIFVLLTTFAATISALAALLEKGGSVVTLISNLFNK